MFTPRGDVIGAADRLDAGRLRLRHPHRGRPPHHRRPGQRPAGAAGVRRSSTATSSRCSPPSRRTPARRRDWLQLRQVTAGPQQDPPLVHQGAARGGHRAGQGADRPAAAQGGPAAQAGDDPRVAHPGRQRAARAPTCPRCTPRSARATSAPRPSYARSSRSPAATTGAAEDLAEAVTITRPRRRSDRAATTPVSWSRARPTYCVKLARCCTPVPGDEILGFVTRGDGISVHRRDCTNATQPAQPARAARRGRVGADRAVDVPGADHGRGPRPGPAALRHHHGALRPAREHPLGAA